MMPIAMLSSLHFAALAACVGVIGGVSAGLCGVSPGGALVVLSTILLGVDQHVAQGLSVAVQVPPTALSGLGRYRQEARHAPMRWFLWLLVGFPLGSAMGALLARSASSAILEWSYVGYLAALAALLIVRPSNSHTPTMEAVPSASPGGTSLVTVGLLAGVSSGYLGIGGGLVIVAGLSGALKVPQHQAQMMSLLVSLVPVTVPAAYVYWRMGAPPP
jgi:uncharacterized membrane protein YfcA